MNDKKFAVITFLVIASISSAAILVGCAANAFTLTPNFGPMIECLALKNPQVSEKTDCLNASLTILNCGGPTFSINAIKLGEIAHSSSPGVAICVNGTYVDTASPLFVIQPNDTAIVNMIIPYTSFPYALSTLNSANVASITVVTDEAMYYTECNSSGGVSG